VSRAARTALRSARFAASCAQRVPGVRNVEPRETLTPWGRCARVASSPTADVAARDPSRLAGVGVHGVLRLPLELRPRNYLGRHDCSPRAAATMIARTSHRGAKKAIGASPVSSRRTRAGSPRLRGTRRCRRRRGALLVVCTYRARGGGPGGAAIAAARRSRGGVALPAVAGGLPLLHAFRSPGLSRRSRAEALARGAVASDACSSPTRCAHALRSRYLEGQGCNLA